MTSYANTNDTPNAANTATNAATTTTTTSPPTPPSTRIDLNETSAGTPNYTQREQQFHDNASPATATTPLLSNTNNNMILSKKLPTLPLEDFYIDSPHLLNNSNGGSYSSPNTTLASSSENYDCDSLSDGHEKADTTPENIKKIDDIIDEQRQQQHHTQQQQQQVRHTALNATRFNNAAVNAQTIEPSLLGLAAAIDDSNAKYLYATKQKQSPTHHQTQQQQHQQQQQQRQHDKDILMWKRTPSTEERVHPQYEGVYQPIDTPTDYEIYEGKPAGNAVRDNTNRAHGVHSKGVHAKNDYNASNGELHGKTQGNSSGTAAAAANETESDTTPTKANKFSCAFTIDPFNDKDGQDPVAAAAKYKNMLERFQNRHRRGASLSKVETSDSSVMTQSANAATMSTASPVSSAATEGRRTASNTSPVSTTGTGSARVTRHNANRNSCEIVMEHAESGNGGGDGIGTVAVPASGAGANVVKMRARDRSTSRVRDASKRHSWSPRSSTAESQQQHQQQQQQHSRQQNSTSSAQSRRTPTSGTTTSTTPTSKSSTPRTSTASSKTKPPPLQMPRGAANLVANRTQFTPRSTAMQLAMQAVDLICPQPPLAEFTQISADAADNLSEAGTYTLDGDNYTEEQKEIMNIDKNARQKQLQQQQQKLRPKELHLKEVPAPDQRSLDERKFGGVAKRGNVLEVNYYHETAADELPMSEVELLLGTQQHADVYMQNLRTHITGKLAGATPNDCEPEPERTTVGSNVNAAEDVGIFTSVTKSGVLAKQSALDPRPNLTRRGSLSTSQIDSSEYVSKDAKTKQHQQQQQQQLTANVYPGGSFTDHQKSEYCLNVFHKQEAAGKRMPGANTRNNMMIESPPQTPLSTKLRAPIKLADTAALKTAQTKEEWIKVWARNARAHSIANDTRVSGGSAKTRTQASDELMTRSYTCSDTGGESLTDDIIYNNQLKKTLNARHRVLNNAATGECDYSSDPSLTSTYARSQHDVSTGTGGTAYKPPKSPTKIPSPMHSIGRARSTSRARPALHNILSPDADGPGEVYGQRTNVSRKSSIKSPEHATTAAGMLRAQTMYAPSMLSPEDCGSPQHSMEGSPAAYRRSPSQQTHQSNHRRVISHDAGYSGMPMQPRDLMTSSINEQQLQLLTSGEYINKLGRQRKNSYDGGNQLNNNSPGRRASSKSKPPTVNSQYSGQEAATMSPLRRSTSFSNRNGNNSQGGYHQRAARPQFQNVYTPPALRQQYALENAARMNASNAAIIKSASSNNFRQMYEYSDYDDRQQYYINDQDDELLYVEDDYMSGDECEDEYEEDERPLHDIADEDYSNALHTTSQQTAGNRILQNTRINKALLMRMEMNKQKFGDKPNSAPAKTKSSAGGVGGGPNANGAGVIACPNTPELPRRNIRSAPRAGAPSNSRTSMPRDSSLSRLVNRVPTSLASAKKQLLQTAANGMPTATTRGSGGGAGGQLQKVQPKYMDISKYKSAQSQDFLRRQDPRTTATQGKNSASEGRKSSASASGSAALNRADGTRASSRSTKSMSAGMTTSATGSLSGGNSQSKREWIVNKTKDVELALWKKRATYDPMKAASEDRRRKEEARRLEKAKKNASMETPLAPSGATTTSESADSTQPNSLEQSFTTSTTGSCAADAATGMDNNKI